MARASSRETAMRVAVGGICKRLLAEFGMTIASQVLQIGPVRATPGDLTDPAVVERAEASALRTPDAEAEQRMREAILEAKRQGQTLGGVFEVVVSNVIPGLGSYVHWDRKLDGRLAQAVMSIPAIKAVAIGDGFTIGESLGTYAHDGMRLVDGRLVRLSNRAGGLEGGVTNGQPLVVRAVMKPISTTPTPQPSVDLATGENVPSQYQRSDVCAVPAAGVVAEAMVAFVLADAFLEKFGGDSLEEIRPRVQAYLAALPYWSPARL